MNETSKGILKAEIHRAKTAKEMFQALERYYDFENATPGAIAKGVFINNVPSVLNLLGVKPFKQHK